MFGQPAVEKGGHIEKAEQRMAQLEKYDSIKSMFTSSKLIEKHKTSKIVDPRVECYNNKKKCSIKFHFRSLGAQKLRPEKI